MRWGGGGGKHCADMFPDVAILLQVFQIRFLPCSFVLWFIVPVNKFSLVSRRGENLFYNFVIRHCHVTCNLTRRPPAFGIRFIILYSTASVNMTVKQSYHFNVLAACKHPAFLYSSIRRRCLRSALYTCIFS